MYMGITPFDLPVPPEIDWAELAETGSNWMRDIAEAAEK